MVQVRWKKLRDGSSSAYFDIHWSGRRWYEFLKIRTTLEKTLADREANKELRRYVERIKSKRWNEILNEVHGLSPVKIEQVDFFRFYDDRV